MRRLEQAGKGQSGNILYMTLVMFLLLTAMALGLIRIICLAALKIKLQNAADQLALSAATLQARMLNQMTNINGVLEFVALEGGQVHSRPYYSAADMAVGWEVASAANASALKTIREYQLQAYFLLGRMVRENGWAPETAEVAIYPLSVDPGQDFSRQHETIRYWQEIPCPPGKVLLVNPSFPAVKIEPRNTPWSVQVQWRWKGPGSLDRTHGFSTSWAGLAVRSQAEIYDAAPQAAAWSHHWRVRLRAYDETINALLLPWQRAGRVR